MARSYRRRRPRKKRSSRYARQLRKTSRNVYYPDPVQAFPYESYYKKKDTHPKYQNSKKISNDEIVEALTKPSDSKVQQLLDVMLTHNPALLPMYQAARQGSPMAIATLAQTAQYYATQFVQNPTSAIQPLVSSMTGPGSFLAAPGQYITDWITQNYPGAAPWAAQIGGSIGALVPTAAQLSGYLPGGGHQLVPYGGENFAPNAF